MMQNGRITKRLIALAIMLGDDDVASTSAYSITPGVKNSWGSTSGECVLVRPLARGDGRESSIRVVGDVVLVVDRGIVLSLGSASATVSITLRSEIGCGTYPSISFVASDRKSVV